ncbi:MAG TPA: hypothetical protein VM054_02365 [bacterium]|nr:hypothetical protein [bacterium]
MRTEVILVLTLLAIGAGADVYEFYWDDGTCISSQIPWDEDIEAPFWHVQFDEEKTGGAVGTVLSVGAYILPNWPDSTYQGVYLYVMSDSDGRPGMSLEETCVSGPGWQWADVNVELTDGVFWVALEYIGHYPLCDALGLDGNGTGHTYHFVYGWVDWCDAMLRCYWEGEPPQVVESTWGLIKTLW